MIRIRHQALAALIGLMLLGSAARVDADSIYEPNNSVNAAAVLPGGQLSVTDSLDGTLGRPDTILGHYDPAYSTLHDFDDNGSPVGDGFASQLVDVPLEPNGSAYFRVTGADDFDFIGAHAQSGKYYVQFDLYDSNSVFFKTLSLEFDSVIPGFLDNIWIDPPAIPEPERIGGTVTATVYNIVGPGTGDSLDFFMFTGLEPNQPFSAVLSDAEFDARLGLFGGPSNSLLDSSNGAGAMILGTADGLGRVLLGVTGLGDTDFGGVHAEQGNYTLTLTPVVVPEPSGIALASLGGILAGLLLRRRRRRVHVERTRRE